MQDALYGINISAFIVRLLLTLIILKCLFVIRDSFIYSLLYNEFTRFTLHEVER